MICIRARADLSSIFLNLRGLNLGARFKFANDLAFAVSFVLLRWLVLPHWWLLIMHHGATSDSATWAPCMGRGVFATILVGGVAIHALNAYWGVYILRKGLRLLLGKDTPRARQRAE